MSSSARPASLGWRRSAGICSPVACEVVELMRRLEEPLVLDWARSLARVRPSGACLTQTPSQRRWTGSVDGAWGGEPEAAEQGRLFDTGNLPAYNPNAADCSPG